MGKTEWPRVALDPEGRKDQVHSHRRDSGRTVLGEKLSCCSPLCTGTQQHNLTAEELHQTSGETSAERNSGFVSPQGRGRKEGAAKYLMHHPHTCIRSLQTHRPDPDTPQNPTAKWRCIFTEQAFRHRQTRALFLGAVHLCRAHSQRKTQYLSSEHRPKERRRNWHLAFFNASLRHVVRFSAYNVQSTLVRKTL